MEVIEKIGGDFREGLVTGGRRNATFEVSFRGRDLLRDQENLPRDIFRYSEQAGLNCIVQGEREIGLLERLY